MNVRSPEFDQLRQWSPADRPFGGLLEAAIEASGFVTLAAFAREVGVSKAQVCAIVSGVSRPPRIKLERYLGALDSTVVDVEVLRLACDWEHAPVTLRELLSQLLRGRQAHG